MLSNWEFDKGNFLTVYQKTAKPMETVLEIPYFSQIIFPKITVKLE